MPVTTGEYKLSFFASGASWGEGEAEVFSDIELDNSVRNAFAQIIADACDAGSLNAAAALVILRDDDTPIVTMRMSNPAFGPPSGGLITANAIPNEGTVVGGLAAYFKIVDRDDNEVLRGTVGESGSASDLTLGFANVGAGDVMDVGTLTYSVG